MMVCGLNVTVLCGLLEVELESVGGGRSGDASVEVEAIAGMKLLSLTQSTYGLSWHPHFWDFGLLAGDDHVLYHGELANGNSSPVLGKEMEYQCIGERGPKANPH